MQREELLELFARTAEVHCDLDNGISLKELSPGDSMYAEIGEGFVDTIYYDKSLIETVPVLLLCRHKNQDRCLGQLEDICHYFQRLKSILRGNLSPGWIRPLRRLRPGSPGTRTELIIIPAY